MAFSSAVLTAASASGWALSHAPVEVGDLAQGGGQPGGRTARRSMRLAVAQAHRGDDGGGRHDQYGPDLVRGGDQHWVVPLIWLRMSCGALNTSVVALSSSAPVVRWARAVPRNSLAMPSGVALTTSLRSVCSSMVRRSSSSVASLITVLIVKTLAFVAPAS